MKRICFRLAGSMLLLLSSCSDRSMSLDDEAGDLGPDLQREALLARWSCLSQEPGPQAYAGDEWATITYVVPIGSVLSPDVLPAGLAIALCQLNDVVCSAPLALSVNGAFQVPPGVLALDIPYGFQGYLRLSAPGYVPTAYYFQGPMIGFDGVAHVIGEPILLYDAQTLGDQLRLLVRDPLSPDGGILTVRAIDCLGRVSDGVRVELVGASAESWVELNGLMVLNYDGSLTTDVSGIAGFVNVPAPTTTIVEGVAPGDCGANDTTDGECSAEQRYGRMAVRVQPGMVTIAELRPDYRYGR